MSHAFLGCGVPSMDLELATDITGRFNIVWPKLNSIGRASDERALEDEKTRINRHPARWPILEVRDASKGKSSIKSGTDWARIGTHTTLPLCVPAAPANSRKTATYAPSRKRSDLCKAAARDTMSYVARLESAYFNTLAHRPTLPHSSREAR